MKHGLHDLWTVESYPEWLDRGPLDTLWYGTVWVLAAYLQMEIKLYLLLSTQKVYYPVGVLWAV